MAVTVQEYFPTGDLWRFIVWYLGLQKTTEGKGLLPQAMSYGVMREETMQFVAEDAGTTWFQHDHRQTGINVWR
jgi:hypothetical protein